MKSDGTQIKNKKQGNQPMIWKSNALIEASYRLSVAEQRIMLTCISQVDRSQPMTDQVMYSVSVADIDRLSGTSTHATYDEIKKAALRLKQRTIWIYEKPNGEGDHDQVLVTSWVQSIRYIKREGRVELRFSHDMLPYLSQFVEQFTAYALTDIAKMNSAHAIRLYELLMQWQSQKLRMITVEDLRHFLQLDDKYPLMADLRRWVIEPSVKQINEHSPINVAWAPKKTGRRITHLAFSFEEKAAKKPKSRLPKGQASGDKKRSSVSRATQSGSQVAIDALKQMKTGLT